jgi:uncharacterized paraquat-inducible protein A
MNEAFRSFEFWSKFVVRRPAPIYSNNERWCSRCRIVLNQYYPELRCPTCGQLLRTSKRHASKGRTEKKYIDLGDGWDG